MPRNSARGIATPQLLLAAALVILLVTCQILTPWALCPASGRGFDYTCSDDFYLVSLGRNLLGGACSMTGTHLSGVPYLFPDLLFLLPCLAAFSNVNMVFLGYSLLFLTALAAVLVWLARLTGYTGKQAFVVGCTGVLFVVATNLGEAYRFRAHHFFVAGNHAGVFLNGFLLTALILRSFQRAFNACTATTFVVLGTLAVFSDRLLIVQFLLPISVALSLLAVRRVISRKTLATSLALVLLCVFGAMGMARVFEHLGFVLLRIEHCFNPTRPWLTFARFLRDLPQVFHDQYLALGVIPLFFALAVAVVLRGALPWGGAWEGEGTGIMEEADGHQVVRPRRACWQDLPVERVRLVALALIALLGCLLNFATLIVLGQWETPHHQRYLFFPLFVPFFLMGFLLLRVPPTKRKPVTWAWSLAIAAFAVHRIVSVFPERDRRTLEPPYPPLARAVDRLARERGFRYGLADFWNAKHVSYLSREGVNVRAMTGKGEPYLHCDDPHCFLSPDPRDLRVPTYNFIIVARETDPNDKAWLLAEFGEPPEVQRVEDDAIWIYDRLRSSRFQQFLNGTLAEKCCRRLPFAGPCRPAVLAVPKINFCNKHARGNIKVGWGQELEVSFAAPVKGRMLNVSAEQTDRLEVTFYKGTSRLGRLAVPPAVWAGATYDAPGMQARLLPLPESVREREWDRAVIRAAGTSGKAVVGHFLVFAECPVPEVTRGARRYHPCGRRFARVD